MMPPGMIQIPSVYIMYSRKMSRPSLLDTGKPSTHHQATRESESTIFAVKYDGRHKVRLVADGHLTPDPVESFYLGVVS